jgi:hypothetical protein
MECPSLGVVNTGRKARKARSYMEKTPGESASSKTLLSGSLGFSLLLWGKCKSCPGKAHPAEGQGVWRAAQLRMGPGTPGGRVLIFILLQL